MATVTTTAFAPGSEVELIRRLADQLHVAGDVEATGTVGDDGVLQLDVDEAGTYWARAEGQNTVSVRARDLTDEQRERAAAPLASAAPGETTGEARITGARTTANTRAGLRSPSGASRASEGAPVVVSPEFAVPPTTSDVITTDGQALVEHVLPADVVSSTVVGEGALETPQGRAMAEQAEEPTAEGETAPDALAPATGDGEALDVPPVSDPLEPEAATPGRAPVAPDAGGEAEAPHGDPQDDPTRGRRGPL